MAHAARIQRDDLEGRYLTAKQFFHLFHHLHFRKTREGLHASPLSFCLIAEMKSSLGGRGFRRKAGKPSFNEKDNGKVFAQPPFRKNK
jgi:hypothetical protein